MKAVNLQISYADLPEYTLPFLLFRSASLYPEIRAIFEPHGSPVLELTYSQLAENVMKFGAGLIKRGIAKGDHIALFSDNQPRWLISDLAITGIGAIDVPRGSDTADSEFEFILTHSGASAAIVQNKKLFDRLSKSNVFSALKLIILMDDSDVSKHDPERVLTFSQVLASGADETETFVTAARNVTPDNLATIVYTSGTTGSPKGVMLTHTNLMTQPLLVDLGYRPSPGEIQLSILPSWHAYERATEYFGFYYGTTLAYSDKKYIREDLLKLCPHLLPCVPRIWESVYKAIYNKLESAPPNKQKLFKFFVDTGFKYVYAKRIVSNENLTTEATPAAKAQAAIQLLYLGPLYRLGDKLVFSKLRQITGGRLCAAVSGGGSLAPYLDDFFEVVGIPILNGYGLTETAPVIAVRTTKHNVRGTVGSAIAETEVSIRNDTGEPVTANVTGEIWVRGPQVMSGYYNNQVATDKVMKSDGWFVTGDLGKLTIAGQLVITGRAKDTIVLSSGENIEPEPIEDTCRKSPLIQQIHLVGQDQKALGALVYPEFPKLMAELNLPDSTSHEDVAANPEAEKLLKKELSKVMAADGRFKAIESISRVAILNEPFSEANGMMTNTMKIKRNVVNEKYSDRILKLYQ